MGSRIFVKDRADFFGMLKKADVTLNKEQKEFAETHKDHGGLRYVDNKVFCRTCEKKV